MLVVGQFPSAHPFVDRKTNDRSTTRSKEPVRPDRRPASRNYSEKDCIAALDCIGVLNCSGPLERIVALAVDQTAEAGIAVAAPHRVPSIGLPDFVRRNWGPPNWGQRNWTLGNNREAAQMEAERSRTWRERRSGLPE